MPKGAHFECFFVLGDRTICYCLSSLRNISSPYFTLIQKIGGASLNKLLLHNSCKLNYYNPICSIIVVNRTFMSTLQPKTNRSISDFPYYKKSRRPKRLPLSLKCTVNCVVILNHSIRYNN